VGVTPVGLSGIQLFLFQAHGPRYGPGLAALTGRAGTQVSQVALQRAGGGLIHASLKHGSYLVWWPENVKVGDLLLTVHGQQKVLPLPRGADLSSFSCKIGAEMKHVISASQYAAEQRGLTCTTFRYLPQP
jgi:hypothetical protein